MSKWASRQRSQPYATVVKAGGNDHAHQAFWISYAKLCEAPADLDDDDLHYLGQLDPALARTAQLAKSMAIASRKKAFEAQLAKARTAPSPSAAPGLAVASVRKGEDLDQFFKRAARDAASVGLVASVVRGLISSLKEVNAKGQARIEAMEKRLMDLETSSNLTRIAEPGTVGASPAINALGDRLKALEQRKGAR